MGELVGKLVSQIKLKMNATLAKDVVKAIENTDEQAVFVFDKYGLFIRVADPYHVRVVELLLEPECFESYEFNDEKGEQLRLGIVISRLKDITKTLLKKDYLEMDYTVGTNQINTYNKSIKRSIRLIRVELLNEIPEISVAHHYQATLDSSLLKPFMKAADSKGGLVDFITDGQFILCSETDEGAVHINLNADEVGLHPVEYISTTTFAVSELAKATNTANGQITIRGKQNAPIELSWKTRSGMKVRAWIAQKE